jgi:hypothetical protein
MGQLSTLRTRTFILGSADIRVGDTVGAVQSLGPANGISVEEKWEEIKMEIDNYGEEILGIKNHEVNIKGKLLEIDLELFASIRGGVDEYSIVSGVAVNDHTQVVASGAWEFNKFIQIEHQNGDGSILELNGQGHVDVSGATNGALDNIDDFDMVKVNGKWGIIVKDSSSVTTEAQALTITFDYTPSATKVLTTGGLKVISSKVVQLIHTTSYGETITITIYKAKNTDGMKLDFPADDADKAAEVEFTFNGKCDGTRTVGDQLLKIEDTRVY